MHRIHAAVQQVQHRRYLPDLELRCHPSVAIDLHREALDSSGAFMPASFAGHTPRLLGMEMVSDEWLPRGVWRLCDDDGTLLLDCREGTGPVVPCRSVGYPARRIGSSPVAEPFSPRQTLLAAARWLRKATRGPWFADR